MRANDATIRHRTSARSQELTGAADTGNPRDPAEDNLSIQQDLVRRHLRLGWWCLLLFLTLGAVLETLHGFKLGYYLDVSNTTRRHMWTLAHAHGTLLALLHIAFAASVTLLARPHPRMLGWASGCLTASTALLPGGFFLGGLYIYSGDPGLGIALVPAGGLLLFLAVALTARMCR